MTMSAVSRRCRIRYFARAIRVSRESLQGAFAQRHYTNSFSR